MRRSTIDHHPDSEPARERSGSGSLHVGQGPFRLLRRRLCRAEGRCCPMSATRPLAVRMRMCGRVR